MKKVYLMCVALITTFLLVSSCSDDKTECPPLDDTLAGSISYIYDIDAIVKIGGNIIDDSQSDISRLFIAKLSDTKVSLKLDVNWESEIIKISIPEVPVQGEPYDTNFDHITNGTFTNSTNQEIPVNLTIAGWMKKESITRCSPVLPNYSCNVKIECTVNEEKIEVVIHSAKTL